MSRIGPCYAIKRTLSDTAVILSTDGRGLLFVPNDQVYDDVIYGFVCSYKKYPWLEQPTLMDCLAKAKNYTFHKNVALVI